MEKGRLFNKKYRVINIIKSGENRNVFLTEHIYLHTFWVIKEWKYREFTSIPLEAVMLSKLNHHDIPKAVDYFEENRSQYLVEEYVEGMTLEDIIKERGRIQNRLGLEWMCQLCKVLEYIHNIKPHPIIHGDIKPSNIIVSPDKTIKLIDFGASKPESISNCRYFATEGYSAPEQYYSAAIDQRCDIYSVGAVLYFILTGKHPGKRIQFESGLSENIFFVIDKCTSIKELRYYNIRELKDDLFKNLNS